MAQGYQFGTACYPTMLDVAEVACASANGLVSAGYQSCTGVSIGVTDIQLSLLIKGSGEYAYTQKIKPSACQYPTFNDTYLPLLAVIIPVFALVFVGKKMVSIFNYDGSASN